MRAIVATWAERFGSHPDGSELPAHHDHCLGCGADNPHGHHLRATRQRDRVLAEHTFDDRHMGAPGIVHGGAVATVIDDLYGFLLYLEGEPAVTRQLVVDYRAPVMVGTPYRLDAHVTRREGRKLFVAATVTELQGRPVVSSTAVFVKVGVEHFAQASDGVDEGS